MLHATIDRRFHDATIDTDKLLEEFYGGTDESLSEEFSEWAETEPLGRWANHFELGRTFMEERGYTEVARDNVYNGENDLSEVFVWEVWAAPGVEPTDWIFPSDGLVVVIYPHLGGDPRGGYALPRFYDPEGCEYTIPVHVTAEVWPVEARDPEGFPVDDMDLYQIVERYSNGYTSAPWFTFLDECRIFAFPGGEPDTLCAVTPDGYRVKVRAGVYVGC